MTTITFIIDAVNSASGTIKQVSTDFTNLGANIRSYGASLASATPQNQAFADQFAHIQDQVGKGFMTIQEGQQEIAKLSAAFDAANAPVRTVGETIRSTVSTIGNLTAAAGIAAVAVGKIWQMGKEGAQIELNRDRFERLAESIGTTADVLEKDLSRATGGMVTNAQQIDLAGQIMSLGLAKTGEDVTRLARLITENGWDMQTVILTFANNSKMRLDSLGLSVEDVTKRAQALVAQGMNMDQAFDLAVIEAGEAKLELLGSAADSAVGDMKRAEASIQNFVDSVKTALVPVLGTAAEAFNTIATSQTTVQDVLATHNAEVVKSADSYEAYTAEMDRAISSAGLVLGVTGMQAEKQKILTEEQFNAVRAASEMEAAELSLAAARVSSGSGLQSMGEYMRTYAENTFYANQYLEMQVGWEYQAYVTSEKFADRLALVNEKSREMTEAIQAAGPPVEELIDTLQTADISSPLGQWIDDLQFFIASGGQDFVGAFQAIKEALASESITPEEAVGFSAELLASIENVKIAAGEIEFNDAAQGLAERLNIPLAEAVRLLEEAGTAAEVLNNLDAQVEVNSNLEELHSDIAAAEQGLEDVKTAADNLDGSNPQVQVGTNLDEINTDIADATGNFESMADTAVAALEPVGITVSNIASDLANIAGNHAVNIHVNVTGDQIPNVGGYGGGAPTGATTPEANAVGSPSVLPGEARIVGEQGRELFLPTQHGTIIPNDQTERILAGGGGGVLVQFGDVNIYSNASDPGAVYQQVVNKLGADLRRALGAGHARRD